MPEQTTETASEYARGLWRELGGVSTAFEMNRYAERVAQARRAGHLTEYEVSVLQGGYAQRYGQLFPDAGRRGRR